MRCKEHLPDDPSDSSGEDWDKFGAEIMSALNVDMDVFNPTMKNFGFGVKYPAKVSVLNCSSPMSIASTHLTLSV